MRVMPGILSQSDVRHLPIIAAFVKKIGVAEVTPQLLAFIKKQMARVYLKAPGALIWAFGDMTHLRYF